MQKELVGQGKFETERPVRENPEKFLESTFNELVAYDMDTQNSFIAALKSRVLEHRSEMARELRGQAEDTQRQADWIDDQNRELRKI